MSTFYIPDERSKKRCEHSQLRGVSDTFSGVDVTDGQVKIYTGVIQLIEDYGDAAPQGRRWLVTVLDN
jgi:hypothetical protein